MVITVEWLVGPHNVGHVLRQLAHHLGILGHNVAPHGDTWSVGRNGIVHLVCAFPLIPVIGVYHLVAAIDKVNIHLVGTFTVYQLFGAAGAELLGLVAVDDEEGRVGYTVVGSLDTLS